MGKNIKDLFINSSNFNTENEIVTKEDFEPTEHIFDNYLAAIDIVKKHLPDDILDQLFVRYGLTKELLNNINQISTVLTLIDDLLGFSEIFSKVFFKCLCAIITPNQYFYYRGVNNYFKGSNVEFINTLLKFKKL